LDNSSHGLVAAGVKNKVSVLRRSVLNTFPKFVNVSVRDSNANPSDKKIEVNSPPEGNGKKLTILYTIAN
jgi:hypothetical protein